MQPYFEIVPSGRLDPTAVVVGAAEYDTDSLLFDEHSLPPEFFDLSSGLAGELLHRLSIYYMRMAAVVPDLGVHSSSFQAFAMEANKGEQFRFFPSRQEAIRWLETPR